jgi:hypothetical protein
MESRNAQKTLRKKRYGRCRICHRFGRLTKEHVPPQSAFNDRGYLEYYVDKFNEAERIKWETRDVNSKGIYLFTLCENCNNRTGRLYGTEYGKFVQAFTAVASPEHARTLVTVEIESLFPLRVVKQAISMMLSTSEPTSFGGYELMASPFIDPALIPPEFDFRRVTSSHLRDIYEELRKFVLNKEAKGLPSDVRLYAYAVANEGSALRTGIGIQARLKTQKVHWVAVVGLWPIHWVLQLHGDDLGDELLDLTDWANASFKTKRSEIIRIPCHWHVGRYPLDFRSQEEFRQDHFVNLMRLEGFVPYSDRDQELFGDAVSFARRKGKWTREGYLMTEFRSGTYFEVYGQRGWLEGLDRDKARGFVTDMLGQK